jgi:hypothetical protein
MLASLSMEMASFIELLTPFFPGYFLPLASVANVGKYDLLSFYASLHSAVTAVFDCWTSYEVAATEQTD